MTLALWAPCVGAAALLTGAAAARRQTAGFPPREGAVSCPAVSAAAKPLEAAGEHRSGAAALPTAPPAR